MKAIVSEIYGGPEILQLKQVDKPIPKDDQVLVKVHASSINPLDWHFMRGTPRMARLAMGGFFKPTITILGADIAGRVEAVGKNIKEFKPGDEVFGTPKGLGGLAEYVCSKENVLVTKPANITFEQAAAIPVAALTALQSLHGNFQPGKRVLINGSSGGVGTFTVQIAKVFGAVVTAVCSSKNADLVKSIGADQIIDYTKEDFTQTGQCYDLIVDNVGNRTVSEFRRALNKNGKCVIVGYTSNGLMFQHLLWGPFSSIGKSRKVGMMATAQSNKKDLLLLKEFVESGKVKPVIDKSYPLQETADAMRYLETGRARAKVVITL